MTIFTCITLWIVLSFVIVGMVNYLMSYHRQVESQEQQVQLLSEQWEYHLEQQEKQEEEKKKQISDYVQQWIAGHPNEAQTIINNLTIVGNVTPVKDNVVNVDFTPSPNDAA